MSYRDVYFSRVNHLGETTAERIKNAGIRSFEKWMAESPFTVHNLSVERGLYFSGIIETNKDKEYEKIMFLRVANDIPIKVGDIMSWEIEDGSVEKWILAQKVKKVNGTYQTFWIIRCNYLLKWIDSLGHLNQSWAYVVSSVDSKIKGNYRTWNSLITPQPNKYAEILMPRYPIDRATNFIIEDESWQVIEYDHTSVPGTIYLSLTENKINLIYDDIDNNIADLDKLARYSLLLPEQKQVFSIGEIIKPNFTIMKNGKPYEAETVLLPDAKKHTKLVDNQLIARSAGEALINIQLKDFPNILIPMTIVIGDDEQQFDAYIEGPETIRLARKATYILKDINGEIIYPTSCILNDIELANIIENKDESDNIVSWTVVANDQNKLTTKDNKLEMKISYNDKEYIKYIDIIPLW